MNLKVLGLGVSVFALAVMTSNAEAETITITADQWCPYNCEPGSEKPGYVVELAREIFAEHGIDVEYVNMPWSRALQAGADGEVEGVIAVSFQPETEEMVLPDEPIVLYEIQAVTAADNDWSYAGVDSLDGDMTVAAIEGYNYGDNFMEWQEANEDRFVINRGDGALEQNLRMVAAGRADFTLDGVNVLRYTMDQMGTSQEFRFAGTVGDAVPLYLGFSKKAGDAESWGAIWTEGVREMREDGRLQEILAKYDVEDWG